MYEYNAIVIRVVDGDTLELEVDLGFKIHTSMRVRLLDVDTPETFHPSCKAERIHGLEATKFVAGEVYGKKVTLHTHRDKKGKYGRYLARIEYANAAGVLRDLGAMIKMNGFEKRDDYAD